jgi:uncharacterized protein YjcR
MTGASKAARSPLGGLRHRQVVRDLALGNFSQDELAEKYGVSQSAISQFKSRHAVEIAAVAADADDAYAGILIADKQARIAAYQEIHDKAMEPTPKVDNKGGQVIDPVTGAAVYEFDGRAAMQALKSVAEEMGQLPTRLQVSGELSTTTTYKIDGVSHEDLT